MKLLVLDGNSILNRAFYGIRLLSNKNGVYTNALYGFMNILIKLKEQEKPDAVAAAFDLKAPTFRHKMYSEYKAGRKPMPEELAMQLPLIKELLRYYGVTVIEKEGYEADDILGTLSLCSEKNGWECSISTGDRDSLQLVGKNTKVLLAATKAGAPDLRIYDEARIFEEHGLTPKQLIDVKALAGDTSDNIPGVTGVGPKTADDLIRKYGSLEEIYNNIESPEIRDNLRQKLINEKDNAFLSLKLGEIDRNVPLDISLDQLSNNKISEQKLVGMLTKLEMFRIIERLGLTNVAPDMDTETKEATPTTSISKIEFNLPKDTFNNEVFVVISTNSAEKHAIIISEDVAYISDIQEAIIATQNSECIISQDLKTLYKYGFRYSKKDFDVTLAAYLLNPSASSYDMSRLMQEYSCPASVIPENSNLSDEDFKSLSIASALPNLYKKLDQLLTDNNQTELMKTIEIPLCKVLADMEITGFSVDKNELSSYGKVLSEKTNELQTKIYNLVGYEFNLNSPKQLGKALFEDLGLPSGKKTKSGYSTSAEVLEELRFSHPAVELLLEYRQLSKLNSTYVEGMVGYIDDFGRIHTTFNQTETRTGRISSLEPNLQNIPVRKEAGKELRRFFKAKDGYVLCDADYSQIELRVLAHMSEDENMINAFISNTDIHTVTASQVFQMPEEMVTPLMRSRAKAVNFGIVYGIGAFSLAKDIGVTFAEAKRYIEGYLATYKGVSEYMQNTVEQAKENGYVTTMFGRRRYLPELSSKNGMLRSFGERVARNMPIQGTAADIIKIAMINVHNAIKEQNLKSRLILQVHDELIVEAPENEKEIICEIIKTEMENAVSLKVPLTVDVGVGATWFDAKK